MQGHFTWGSLHVVTPAWNEQRNISCLTVFRDPVDRVRSCYYYRFPKATRRFSEHSEEDLSTVLRKNYSLFGEGGPGTAGFRQHLR